MSDTGPDLPWRCIWCKAQGDDVVFNESHVLPECVGNYQQTLPPGIVCAKCNNFFGTGVEPALLADPAFHTMAVALELIDVGDMKRFRETVFDREHPPVEPIRPTLALSATREPNAMELSVSYSIEGRLRHRYDKRALALFSRAVHKVAYESFAHSLFVKKVKPTFDIFSEEFEPTREWARRGQPQNQVRPILRRPGTTLENQWGISIWDNPVLGMGVELKLFGEWYGVSLTAAPDTVLNTLRRWAGERITVEQAEVWIVGDELSSLTGGPNWGPGDG